MLVWGFFFSFDVFVWDLKLGISHFCLYFQFLIVVLPNVPCACSFSCHRARVCVSFCGFKTTDFVFLLDIFGVIY